MSRPISTDLRERLVLAVSREGISARAAAARFGVSVSSAIVWVRRHRETGSVAPSKIGGYKSPTFCRGMHGDWLVERTKSDFTLRGLVAELAERGVRVDYVQVWRFVHARGAELQKKAFFPPNSSAPRSQGGARSGASIKIDLIPGTSSSSMKRGRRRTWPR